MPDAGGFVCRSQVFVGNVCEHRTLVVMDRGIATGKRVCWLHRQGYRYLVVGRERARHFDAENSLRIRTAANRAVRLHKVVSDDGLEARPYCFSEERAAKERGIVERFAKRSGQVLTELSKGFAGLRARKRIERIRERIGRHAVAVPFSRRPLQGSTVTHPGGCRLRTNPTDRDGATLWRTHMTPTGIGAVFRSPKPNRACVRSIITSPSRPRATCPSPSSPTNPCR